MKSGYIIDQRQSRDQCQQSKHLRLMLPLPMDEVKNCRSTSSHLVVDFILLESILIP
jgi:hypothetical protein